MWHKTWTKMSTIERWKRSWKRFITIVKDIFLLLHTRGHSVELSAVALMILIKTCRMSYSDFILPCRIWYWKLYGIICHQTPQLNVLRRKQNRCHHQYQPLKLKQILIKWADILYNFFPLPQFKFILN